MVTLNLLITFFVQLSISVLGVISGTAKLLCAIDLFMAFNSDLQILLTLYLHSFVGTILILWTVNSSIPRYL